jgi:hypothetical protein
VETGNVTVAKNQHVLMTAPLRARQVKFLMEMVVVRMIVHTFQVLHGMIISNVVYAPHNILTMEMETVCQFL